jgi:hypothetical protein
MKAGAFVPAEVNAAFDLTCPELKSEFARYPIKYSKWYGADDSYGEQPMFVASGNDMGMKLDYVFCKRGPKGKGYYHFLTQMSYTNLVTRISANPPPGMCCCTSASLSLSFDAWDTTKRVLQYRTRLSRPDDSLFGEQGIHHMTQNHINPLHGITG